MLATPHRPLLRLAAALVAAASFVALAHAQPTSAAADDAESAAPADNEAPTEADPPAEPAPELDVDALRQEYLKLRDRLFRSRARAAAVASALYSTRISIHLDYSTARFYTVNRATIRLDGANVYDDSSGAIATDKAPRFEGYIAPGRHQLTIRIEATGKDDERFTSVVDNSFVVQAPSGKDLVVKAKAKDGGNIPYQWKKSESGTYQLALDISVKSVARGGKDEGRIRRASN